MDNWQASYDTWDKYKAARKTADDLWHQADAAYKRKDTAEYTRLMASYHQASWYADQCYLAHTAQRREDEKH